MTLNTFGNIFRFTSFGESHGAAVGGVIDGCPAGVEIDFNDIRYQLDRRAGRIMYGTDEINGINGINGINEINEINGINGINETNGFVVSARAKSEQDEIEWLSGIFEGKTLGTPIAFIIRNKDARPEDYADLVHVFRPGHADYTYQAKYGIRDYRGGGRASARETAARVVAGTIARQLLRKQGIEIKAGIIQIGDKTNQLEWSDYVREIASEGDTIGGIIRCTISNMPVGLGEPVFGKLQSCLASAILSINACRGFDFGTGFDGVGLKGSEANDISGGILGGISDGGDIVFRAVFKPAPSISKQQKALDDKGNTVDLQIKGRHDVCFLPRAVPVVEAMTALAIANLEFGIRNLKI